MTIAEIKAPRPNYTREQIAYRLEHHELIKDAKKAIPLCANYPVLHAFLKSIANALPNN